MPFYRIEVVSCVALNERKEKFALEWVIDNNATQAAIRARYSKRTAYSIGQRLLKDVEVRKLIDSRLAALESARVADAKEVMQYLTAVMRGEKDEETVVVEGTGDGCSEARVMTKKIGGKDQVKAAELLAKRYGLLTENVKLSGEGVVQIVDDLNSKTE